MKYSTTLIHSTLLLSTALIAPYAVAQVPLDASPETRAFNFFTDSNNGWSEATVYTHGELNTDGGPDGVIAPGGGGQSFDTEYLFFRYNEGTSADDKGSLSIGLQAGFDLLRNRKGSSGYYGGDLALSFDGIGLNDLDRNNDSSFHNDYNSYSDEYSGTYEYAVDFGKVTKNAKDKYVKDGSDTSGTDGKDAAGLYRVTDWDNTISNASSSPFAMDDGTLKQQLSFSENSYWQYSTNLSDPGLNSSGKGFTDGDNNNQNTDGTYYRIVTFDLKHIDGLSENFTIDAHWTMSCGNDAINGQFYVERGNSGGNPVPEPSAIALMAIGSLSLGFAGYRRRKFKL